MNKDQIRAHFKYLRDMADKIAGADLADPERKVIQGLADSAFQIFETVVLDINRIANALERTDR